MNAREPDGAPEPIDVVVVAYRSGELLLDCCRSVESEPGVRLIVVDNAPGAGDADAVESGFPAATVIRSERNEGFARAVNRGAAVGDAPAILLLNPDARLRPGALDQLRAALGESPRIAAVGPRVRGPDGALELTTGRTMTPFGDLRIRLLERLHAGGRGILTGPLERRYDRPREVSSLSGACLLLRREAFDEVGGMDERFFLYAEDVDLCRRLRTAGWRLHYTPAAEADHVRGASARHDPTAVEIAWRRSQLAYYDKHAPAWSPLLRQWVLLRYRWRARFGAPGARDRARALLDRLGEDED